MSKGHPSDDGAGTAYASTGHLPPSEQVRALVDEA